MAISNTTTVLIYPDLPISGDYVAFKGQDFVMSFIWKDEDDVAVDLSSATATYKVRTETPQTFMNDYALGSPVISGTEASEITMDANGNIEVRIPKADIDSIDPGIYLHTLTITLSSVPTHMVVGEWRLKGSAA